ncbi:MAG TPA: tripartite tricarboxylate transporter TctB family protein [Clostridiales bacterium]|nr:tripartite tricarboxylate transporter TctB family protein [Clostridiales bacterium]
MAIELIVNVLLLIISVFCFFYVGATMPKSSPTELGAEQWPQAILILLFIAILWNLRNYFKRNAKDDIAQAFKNLGPDVVNFFKSKLFRGMVLLVVMAWCYEPVGFLATCILFMIAYGVLLGERRPWFLIATSLVITLILYIGFAVFLGVLLPRGYVPFLREIALFLEKVFQGI